MPAVPWCRGAGLHPAEAVPPHLPAVRGWGGREQHGAAAAAAVKKTRDSLFFVRFPNCIHSHQTSWRIAGLFRYCQPNLPANESQPCPGGGPCPNCTKSVMPGGAGHRKVCICPPDPDALPPSCGSGYDVHHSRCLNGTPFAPCLI